MQSTDDELLVLWPRHPVPGAIAVVVTAAQAERLKDIERAMSRSVFVVRVVISDHVPLGGSLAEVIAEPARSSIKLNQTPLTIYLHHGSHAVFFDLLGGENQELAHSKWKSKRYIRYQLSKRLAPKPTSYSIR